MKYYLSLSLIVVFLGLSIFGFLAFNHEMTGESGGCFASAIDGTSCPLNVLNYVLHHFLALQMFTKGLVAIGLDFLASLILIGFLLSFWFCRGSSLLYYWSQFASPRWQNFKINLRPNQSKLIHWLSLLEQSPTL